MAGDDDTPGDDADSRAAHPAGRLHRPLPVLPMAEGWGWTSELRNLVTAVIGRDQQWAMTVLDNLSPSELRRVAIGATALLTRLIQDTWGLQSEDMAAEWQRITVRLAEAEPTWERGAPFPHPAPPEAPPGE